MALNEKTPAGRTKDELRSLVNRLAEELEDEYRRSAGNLVDPKVLAWRETRRFVLNGLGDQARAGLEMALK